MACNKSIYRQVLQIKNTLFHFKFFTKQFLVQIFGTNFWFGLAQTVTSVEPIVNPFVTEFFFSLFFVT